MDTSEIRSLVVDVLEEHPDSDMSRAGILLWSAFQVGTTSKALREFSGLPFCVVRDYGFYARQNGIWQGQLIRVDWEHEDYGHVAFVLDCMVTCGRVVRSEDTQGALSYRLRMLGDFLDVATGEDVPWHLVADPDRREAKRLARTAT